MEFLSDYGLFLAKSVTVLVVVLIIVAALAAVATRQRRGAEHGRIETRRLNDVVDDMRDALRSEVLDEKAFGKLRKQEAKAEKAQAKKDAREPADSRRRRVWVIDFDGDVQASGVSALRNEVTAILTLAEPGDEVVACVESPGGMVHGYGLAASQLHRIRSREGVTLTVAVDMVAASGGYLMACLGERILAAPFAIVGSIGVVAQVPNVHRLLKRHDIDVEVLTAGEYKRTLTVFGENTDKGRQKFIEELEDVHGMFKDFVSEQRPKLDMAQVATGEAWHGRKAVELGLVDELITSDEYLTRACAEADVIGVRWVEHRSPVERLIQQSTSRLAEGVERVLLRWRDRSTWTG
ncbi:MAG TPA: protease SohB [Pseudomonadales bacterium]|nr:protease SohB [Pseudomonadales bacterium]